MNTYFTYPYAFCKAKSVKAEGNPTFCQKIESVSNDEFSNEEMTKIVIVERSFNLPTFTEEELQTEQWKTINGFPMYMISSLGRVFSKRTYKILRPCYSKAQKKDFSASAIVGLTDGITRRENGKLKYISKQISSLVKEHFMTVPKSLSNSVSKIVVHKNNNPYDCRLSNLFITSMKNRVSMPKKKEIVRIVYTINSFVIDIIEDILNGKYPKSSIYYLGDNFVIIESNSKDDACIYEKLLSSNLSIWHYSYLSYFDYKELNETIIKKYEEYALAKLKRN